MTLIHATGIYIDGKGVLLRGPSGSGKSDLALRMMALGADLIGDDYVDVSRESEGRVIMHTPKNIAGLIEVHNVGLLKVTFRPEAPINLVIDLVGEAEINRLERLPEPKTMALEGREIPCLDFYAFESSAPEKLRAALILLT